MANPKTSINTMGLIINVFIGLQLFLIFFTFLGVKYVCLKEGYLGRGIAEFVDQPLIYSRANFDGYHYTKIARDGYGYLQQAFFPLYPRMIRFLEPVFDSFLVSGLVISNLAFVFALLGLVKLLRQEREKGIVIKDTLFFLAVFPTAFYFLSVYTESLFLLFLVWSFYFARKKNWFMAGIVAGLASYTRVVGIFLVPALLWEYWDQRTKKGKQKFKRRLVDLKRGARRSFNLLKWAKKRLYHFKHFIFIIFSGWGFVIYGLELQRKHRDFFYFAAVQEQFGAQRSGDRIILLYQVFWRYLKMIFTVDTGSLIYFNVWLEFLTAVFFIFLLILALVKYKIRGSYLIFSALAFVLPTLTGTFSSLPRYVIVLFPLFWVMGKLSFDYPRLSRLVLFLTALVQAACIIFFTRGYWIS